MDAAAPSPYDLIASLRVFTGGPFGQNGYLLTCPDTGVSAVVDPGAWVADLLAVMDREKLRVEAILLTHAHLDHVEGLPALRDVCPAPIYLHPMDQPLYDAVQAQAQAFGLQVGALPPPDRELHHGDQLQLGAMELEVIHAPGHAPGHVMFYLPSEGLALVGDVVFQGSIGRTDLPGGDFRQLMESIRSRVLTLPDETRLLPGHGPETTVARERDSNPFLVPHFGGELA